jgi:hypothetical protein
MRALTGGLLRLTLSQKHGRALRLLYRAQKRAGEAGRQRSVRGGAGSSKRRNEGCRIKLSHRKLVVVRYQVPTQRPVAGGRTLAMQLHICQLDRQSSRGALRLVVCARQRRLFVRHPRCDVSSSRPLGCPQLRSAPGCRGQGRTRAWSTPLGVFPGLPRFVGRRGQRRRSGARAPQLRSPLRRRAG